jgi:hypothetical protein
MTDPGALSYLAFGFIDRIDGYFFFTVSWPDTLLTHCAYHAVDTLRVAFTAICGAGCSATAHTCAIE